MITIIKLLDNDESKKLIMNPIIINITIFNPNVFVNKISYINPNNAHIYKRNNCKHWYK